MKASTLFAMVIFLFVGTMLTAAPAVSPPRSSATLPTDSKAKAKKKKNGSPGKNESGDREPNSKLVPAPQHQPRK